MDERNKPILKNGNKNKSATKYPKQLPSYVVAFTFQESLNDLTMCQETPQSNENDNASIKTVTSNNLMNRTSIIRNIAHELDINEVKIDILDENQYAQLETKSSKTVDVNKLANDKGDEQPQVLYDASKKRKLVKKRPKKNKRVIKLKNIHFKLKHRQNTVSRRLVKYKGKTKRKSINPFFKDIQKQFYSNEISTVVARSQILKRASAKENLLSEADRKFLNEIINFNKNENASIASSLSSSTTNSFKSFTSQKTLMPESSICSSQNADFFSLETMNSAIELSQDVKTFKTDAVNMAIAVTCEPTKTSSCTKIVIDNDTKPTEKSSSPASDAPHIYETETVIETTIKDSTYCASCTSSNINKCVYSDLTLINESQSSNDSCCQNVFGEKRQNIVTVETNILKDVMNIEQYDITPSTSNGLSFDKFNDVLITDTGKIDVPYAEKSTRKNWSKNIYNKVLDHNQPKSRRIKLPNDAKIRAELTENAKRRSEAETNNVANVNDMWERLTLVMELAVKRLEDSLSEKILTELKKTLSTFKHHTSHLISPATSHSKPETVIHNTAENDTPNKTTVIKDSNLENSKKYCTVQCVQCDLVQNHVIDRIMLNLSVGDIKAFPSVSFQKKDPLSKSYHKTSKPFQSVLAHVGKGDTVAVATTTSSFPIENTRFRRLCYLFSRPGTFVRENLFIFVSVPVFFIVLLCIYELFVLIIKLL